jgi:GNAT superfamily N-acetyltransferase
MVIFKTATVSDAQQITNLVNSAYRGNEAKQGWTTEADILDGQRTDIESINQIILEPLNFIELAFEHDELLGLVHLQHEDKATLYFGMLTVSPTAQARGLGKKLIEHIEAHALKNHLTRLRITVIHLRTELIAYYERRGFVASGNSIPFPTDPLFGIPKVEGLKLIEFTKDLSIY